MGWHDDEGLSEKIADTINRFMPYEERKKRNEIGRNYVDGRGANRIAAELTKNAKN